MSWASRRRNLYLLTFGTISFVTAALLGFLVFYKAPTCTDGVRNGDETGIDCGGGCARVCREDATAPIVRWSRSFEVKTGLWSSVAFVENPNPAEGSRSARYVFKLFDAENIIVAIKEGETTLAPRGVTPVFYANIATGNRTPVRTFFEFTEAIEWERMGAIPSLIRVARSELQDEATMPRLSARIENATGATLGALPLTAIIYDTEGNAVAASQTILPTTPRDGFEDVVFTWPAPFARPASRSEILPTIPLPKVRF